MGCIITTEKVDIIKGKEQDILNELYKKIPVGFNSKENGLNYEEFKSASGDKNLNKKVNDKLAVQRGTLGSGNHFIEIGESQEGYLSITIHSGSRNSGHSVASYWMSLSKNVDKHLPNGFLDINGEYGKAYLQDLDFMLKYALHNRLSMMKIVLNVLGLRPSYINGLINENHNHAIVTPDGVLHRKGATPADKGQMGIIPGNMADGVFVTKGLGNEEYLSSSSHGAGRKFSRKKAKEAITLDTVKEEMDGIVCKIHEGIIDESKSAYKDVFKVIERQEGKVIEVIDLLKPLISVKG
jgi:tRNA-splicing ligase RtcB